MDWLREIVMPAENVEPRYLQYQVETESGEVVEGVRASEDEESLTIRQSDGSQVRIERGTIIDLKVGGSPMPSGFGSQLAPEQIADLIEYLQHH